MCEKNQKGLVQLGKGKGWIEPNLKAAITYRVGKGRKCVYGGGKKLHCRKKEPGGVRKRCQITAGVIEKSERRWPPRIQQKQRKKEQESFSLQNSN